MNAYLINLVFRIAADNERVAQFDEQLRLVHAASLNEAYEKGLYLALDEEGLVKNIDGAVLSWNFVGITKIMEIEGMKDREAIHTSTRETFLPGAYIDHVKEKQQSLILAMNKTNGEIPVLIR